jgi:hypothetical protein
VTTSPTGQSGRAFLFRLNSPGTSLDRVGHFGNLTAFPLYGTIDVTPVVSTRYGIDWSCQLTTGTVH